MTFAFSTSQFLNRLRMRQVALLLALGEHKTLHAAARELGMTQPAATKMLRSLEEALGETLFIRKGRGLNLSPAGQVVMNTFQSLCNNIESLKHELHELRLGSAGHLYVGSIAVATPSYLAPVLIKMKKLYPLLSIEVQVKTSDQLIGQLYEGTLDIVIGRLPASMPYSSEDFLFRPIDREDISIVIANDHPLSKFKKKKIDIKHLLDYSWVLQTKGSPLREIIEREFEHYHLALPRGNIETSSILTLMSLVCNSDMIATIPRSIAEHYEKHQLLRTLPYTFSHSLTQWGSITCRGRTVSPITQDFLDILHA